MLFRSDVLLATLLTYAAYRIWKVGPIIRTLVVYGVRQPPSDIRWRYMFIPVVGAALATGAVVLGQRNMWKVEKDSPWATKEYPQWLSEIGQWHAESYLRAQATLAATSAFDCGAGQFTPEHIEVLRSWYEGNALAKEVPFEKLADDATQRTQLLEVVKTVVKRAKESPFGYCGVTQAEWNGLIPIIKF